MGSKRERDTQRERERQRERESLESKKERGMIERQRLIVSQADGDKTKREKGGDEGKKRIDRET